MEVGTAGLVLKYNLAIYCFLVGKHCQKPCLILPACETGACFCSRIECSMLHVMRRSSSAVQTVGLARGIAPVDSAVRCLSVSAATAGWRTSAGVPR